MLDTMAPYKLGMTMTSNWPGLATSCMDLEVTLDNEEERIWGDGIRVIDDHVVVLKTRRLVLLRNPTEGVQEQTITKLHDVGFVDACNFL